MLGSRGRAKLLGMTALPRRWREAMAELRALLERADRVAGGAQLGEDLGGRRVTVDCSTAKVDAMLAVLPGEFDLRHGYTRELHDGAGAVDTEYDHRVYACDAERALLVATDHWQSGLHASVTVYETEGEYEAALKEHADEIRRVDDDPNVTDIITDIF